MSLSVPNDSDFEAFWRSYPRRIGKGAARRAYHKALTLSTHDQIMEGVKTLKKAIKMEGREMQFVPHPSTWLNQERWEDEYVVKCDDGWHREVKPQLKVV